MSLGRLFTYATWAAFLITGTLFLRSVVQKNDEGAKRHIAAGTPGLSVQPGKPAGRRYQPPAPRDVPIRIEVYDFGFAPSNTIVKVGQAIAFKGVGKQIHNLVPTSPEGEKVFRDAQARGSARPLFKKPGVYPFTCQIHPQMRGTVTVVSHF
jgi:plastocyanin